MKYETVREMTPETVAARSEDGREVFLDKVDFAIVPRDNVRFEIQNEIRGRIEQTKNVEAEGLLKYSAFIKHDDQLWLVRDLTEGTWKAFKPENFDEVCRALLAVLKVTRAFHSRGMAVGGFSRGQLKRSTNGQIILQEPGVLNHICKWLTDESYLFEDAPEVIRGGVWGFQADLFSWGVLAYQLITGRHPFFAANDSDRIAQVLRGKIAEPKEYYPRLSNELNQMIVQALSVDPSARPELETLISLLSEQIEHKTYEVSETEAEQYALRSKNRQKQHQFQEKTWLWFRRNGRWVSVVAACLVVTLAVTFGFRSKSVVTRKTPPRAVVNYYFQGIRQVNVSLMMDTLHHAKNSMDDIVSNVHVMNMQQIAVNPGAQRIKIRVDGLKIVQLSRTENQIKYKVNYEFEAIVPKHDNETMYREDEFTLEPVHHVWKITRIKILKENHSPKSSTK